jgi:DNA-binding NarL/FixJ family response regulator/tetratricopeptide (TPR) repeat protein
MALLTDQFVGRAEQLDTFERVLGEVDQGSPFAIALIGEPGIGKTRFLAECAHSADQNGRLVLAGSASELEQDLPFSVFVDALDEYLRGLSSDRLAILDEDVRTELSHVFPALAALGTAGGGAFQHERYRSHRAVRALLEELAKTRSLVLMLDDVHWADPASLELLGALFRRPPDAGVLIVFAVRPHRMSERLSAAIERADRAGAMIRIELGALTALEAQELVGEEAAELYAESGGNPFYLEQLARSLGRHRGAHATLDVSLSGIEVPSAVAASLSEELGFLSDDARRVLEGASVAGDPFEPELAAAAAGTSEAVAMEAIDDLLLLDLVRSTEVPRRFRFRHPLIRRAVYEATLAGWRLGAHERCADLLAARGATAAARAHHVERSARDGDLGAVAVLREAGDGATRLAPASAANWFAHALRLLPASAPLSEQIELLLARSAAQTASGHFADSHNVLLEALVIAPDNATVVRRCAAVESLLGRHEQAGTRLATAIERLPDQGSAEAVALMNELAVNLVWRARYDQMHACAERAVTTARRLCDPAALALLTMAESMTGAAERAEACRREATALVDSLSDEDLARHLESATRLAGMELYAGWYADGDRHASRALALARATGEGGELFLVLVLTLGGLWRMRGKLADAGELLDGGIEAARLLGNTHALVWSLGSRSAAALHTGDVALALAAAEEAVGLSADLDEGFHSAEAAVDLARALLETGEPQRAVDLLVGSAGGEELVLIAGGPRAHYLESLTLCWLALDRPSDARRAAVAAEAWASSLQLPMAIAWANRAAAAVDLYTGNASAGAERALLAVAGAEEVAAPIEAALSRTLAGRALAQTGERDRAIAELHNAAGTLEACGALRWRAEAERELRKLGHRIHRRTARGKSGSTGLEALTSRELQVARLVVDRKTNPQIAAELFLSQKTVETHLRNIFRKVDVSSRVELARTVERADSDA